MRLTTILFMTTAVGCTSDEADKQAMPPDDINQIWKIKSQTCGGAPLDAGTTLNYRFDDNFVVRVEKTANDEMHECNTGYLYNQVVSSTESGTSYRQTATLTASATKIQCWIKRDGMRVEPPADDVGEFGPELIDMTMVVSSNDSLALDLVHAPACPSGTLHAHCELNAFARRATVPDGPERLHIALVFEYEKPYEDGFVTVRVVFADGASA